MLKIFLPVIEIEYAIQKIMESENCIAHQKSEDVQSGTFYPYLFFRESCEPSKASWSTPSTKERAPWRRPPASHSCTVGPTCCCWETLWGTWPWPTGCRTPTMSWLSASSMTRSDVWLLAAFEARRSLPSAWCFRWRRGKSCTWTPSTSCWWGTKPWTFQTPSSETSPHPEDWKSRHEVYRCAL